MEFWFAERHTASVQLAIGIKQQLHGGESEFQRIDVFDTVDFGRMLALDGYLMLTEKDEWIYHEMIVHVPMAVLLGARPEQRPLKALVIGGGDGGTVRELTRYDVVGHIDLVEIDEEVVKACQKFLPQTACRLTDPRVRIVYEDGLKYIRHHEDEYDLILVDSTDPFGPGEGLFTREFYGNCFKALTADGVMVNQHESPFYPNDAYAMQRAHRRIVNSFPLAEVYQAHIPTYPSGHWLFGFASKRYHPVRDLRPDAWNALGLATKYYNTRLHCGAFALPNYVIDLLSHA